MDFNTVTNNIAVAYLLLLIVLLLMYIAFWKKPSKRSSKNSN